MTRIIPMLAVALLAIGCDQQRDDADPNGGIDTEARQWTCEDGDDKVTCTAAIAARDDEPGAYACQPGEEGRACPPAGAIDELADGSLDAVPWACLLTGEHQRHCMKELIVDLPQPDPGDPTPPGDPDPGDPGAGDDTDPRDPGAPVGDPEVPGDCDPLSWEAYFCDLSSFQYQEHGVDITFPCEIFDALAPFASTFPDIPTGNASTDPDLPSCHEGEWGMRDQAWMDAVFAGCMNLNDPILVMCQQAANYAPNNGACSATGTW